MSKILFLHSELAKYFIASVKELSAKAEVHVVHWPVNAEAPFEFKEMAPINFYPKDGYTREEMTKLAVNLKPDMVVVSGWRDKDYMLAIRALKNTKVRVISLDNPWKGNLKQWAWTALSRNKLLPFFTHCWVAGERQRSYAKKLGFKKHQIIDKLYTADNSLFERVNEVRRTSIGTKRPKRFVYIGRYSKEKGIDVLFDAFLEYSTQPKNDWELWCLGTGPMFDQFPKHDRIRHFGFVQPENMPDILQQVDAFILPSTFEPWGLVAHEMAAAGLPLILSDNVGATEQFLIEGKNGFMVRPGSKMELVSAMTKMSELNDQQYSEMSNTSSELAKRQSPAIWTDNVMELL